MRPATVPYAITNHARAVKTVETWPVLIILDCAAGVENTSAQSALPLKAFSTRPCSAVTAENNQWSPTPALPMENQEHCLTHKPTTKLL